MDLYLCGLRRCTDSTTPYYIADFAGWRLAWGGRRKRDRRCQYDHLLRTPPWWRLVREDRSYCWLSQGMLAMPMMLYYVAVSGAKLPTVSDQSNAKTMHG